MKKLLLSLLAGVMLAGCGTATDSGTPEVKHEDVQAIVEQTSSQIDEILAESQALSSGFDLKVLSPTGAPAVAALPAALGSDITFVDGADALQAALVSPDSEYDVVIAPSNLGLKLASAGKSAYKMLGVVTWGNLYIVGKTGTDKDPSSWTKVGAFGEQAVTGIVFNAVYGDKIDPSAVTWYNSTAEAAAALLAGEVDVAMLAEPNATATIGKAKENGLELEIIDDVQAEYSENGFPQAAMFVKEEAYANKKEAIDLAYTLMNAFSTLSEPLTAEEIDGLMKEVGGAEALGVPNAEIIAKTWDRLNINVVKASDHMDELKNYAQLFGIEDITNAVLN